MRRQRTVFFFFFKSEFIPGRQGSLAVGQFGSPKDLGDRGQAGWDWVRNLEIDVDEEEGKGQGVRLEATDTGREEKPGCGGEREWQGPCRGRDEGSARRRGGWTGKGKPVNSHGMIYDQIQIRSL